MATMAHTLNWIVENKVIHAKLWGDLELDELTTINQSIVDRMHDGHPPVYVILDMTGVRRYPTSLPHLARIAEFIHDPYLAWIMLLSDNAILRAVASAITYTTRTRLMSFPTLRAALADIARREPHLKDIIALLPPNQPGSPLQNV